MPTIKHTYCPCVCSSRMNKCRGSDMIGMSRGLHATRQGLQALAGVYHISPAPERHKRSPPACACVIAEMSSQPAAGGVAHGAASVSGRGLRLLEVVDHGTGSLQVRANGLRTECTSSPSQESRSMGGGGSPQQHARGCLCLTCRLPP